MFRYIERPDANIKQDVAHELQWDPRVSAADIKVSVKQGIVTLTGSVPHVLEKAAAEKAAQRVSGVRAIADEVEVNLLGIYKRSDQDVAEAALTALAWNYQVPEGVAVTVEKGWITLRGDVPWEFQRKAARDAVASLVGVKGVTNDIAIQATVKPYDVETSIRDALKRSAEDDGRNITVTVEGSHVVLSGYVHSLSEIADAGTAAWSAPGIVGVENNLRLAA